MLLTFSLQTCRSCCQSMQSTKWSSKTPHAAVQFWSHLLISRLPVDNLMLLRFLSVSLLILLNACHTTAILAAQPQTGLSDAEKFFETKIRPLLIDKCVQCHGAQKQEAELRLDSRAAMLKGNESGPAIVVGKPDASRIMQVLAWSDDDTQMPPAGQLGKPHRDAVAHWISTGAIWPESTGELIDPHADQWKTHWAFQPVNKPAPPNIDSPHIKNDIDRFVAAQLTTQGLSPAPAATARTIVRRASFDLTGLPPTTRETQRLQDLTDEAYAAYIDELLAREEFGERWGRYWLDVARYADTRGYVFQTEREYKDAYTYRDWVMRALNDDMPFDQFLIHQIAADAVVDPGDGKALAAMGFLTLGRRFLNNIHDIIDDRIDVVTRGTMGLTVTCARCHDHKYDPIPTADYYSLYGVFISSNEPGKGASSLRLEDKPKPIQPAIFERGSPGRRGKRVPRQFLMALSSEKREPFKKGSGRHELALAIASPQNPLTARVFVNRAWAHLFGKGLVRTPSDFGLRSEPPTHPKLLDYLAASFMENNWSVKWLVREIMLSATYQQSSAVTAAIQTRDPENRWLSHMNRRRLDFEAHRDSLLFAAGTLERKFGGPSVKVTTAPYSKRRSCYAYIDRQNLPGVFRTFDFASPDTHSPQRYRTTVPQRALYQLNNPFVLEQARALAKRTAGISTTPERTTELFAHAFQRKPKQAEVKFAQEFIAAASETGLRVPVWQYGYGKVDAAAQQVDSFTLLKPVKDAWQTGPILPDPKFGWVMLNRNGGHTGINPHLAAIRRWSSPVEARVRIRGRLEHKSKQGDGVQGRIVSSRHGVVGTFSAFGNSTKTDLSKPLTVQVGDTIDFVADCNKTTSFDSFTWKATLETADKTARWNSQEDYTNSSQPLDAWAQLAQVLLISNEFVFVD